MKPCPKDIERSSVMDQSLALAPYSGLHHKRKKPVFKARFHTPFVKLESKGGKSYRSGKWKCGHRNNPNSR